jgi:hypothetical protein
MLSMLRELTDLQVASRASSAQQVQHALYPDESPLLSATYYFFLFMAVIFGYTITGGILSEFTSQPWLSDAWFKVGGVGVAYIGMRICVALAKG